MLILDLWKSTGSILVLFHERFKSISTLRVYSFHIPIFLSKSLIFFSKRANEQFTQINERFGHLSWATWANSRLLFWHKRPERFAHICSFVLSDVSKSLIVAHLIWAMWAHERMSYERMSELPTLGPLSWADNFFQQQNLDSAQMEVYKSWFYPRNIRS